MRRLTELLQHVPEAAASLTVTGINTDSARIKPGELFVALKGEKTDGALFIPQAEQNGAVAAVCGEDSPVAASRIPVIRAANPRLALARAASAFYGAQPAHIVAVTGTDGKTSTADFFRQFMHLAGKKSASMGTLGVINGAGENLYPGTLTTPDAVALHRMLAELVASGTQAVAMEASSHGLHQHRLDGVRLEAAAFTNLARDHLDYHKTEAEYFAAKARLFAELLPAGGTAVLNQDDGAFPALRDMCARHRVIGFGRAGAEFAVRSVAAHPHGQGVSLELFRKRYDIDVPLVGGFQVMNIVAALGLVVGVGGEVEEYLSYIPQLRGVPGRLELAARLHNGASVFIDYAHTPMALENILRTLRPHTQGALHVVFGCGGDRDAGKRPLMGKAACELADRIVVTDDNPRSENPASIRAAVLAGMKPNCEKTKEVADRAQAIYLALQSLQAGDILVIAGKGHEKTQIIGAQHVPFDDAEVARSAAREQALL